MACFLYVGPTGGAQRGGAESAYLPLYLSNCLRLLIQTWSTWPRSPRQSRARRRPFVKKKKNTGCAIENDQVDRHKHVENSDTSKPRSEIHFHSCLVTPNSLCTPHDHSIVYIVHGWRVEGAWHREDRQYCHTRLIPDRAHTTHSKPHDISHVRHQYI